MKDCNLCGFKNKQVIYDYIGKNAKILFVFECPTWYADNSGNIFEGAIMQNFLAYLTESQIALDDIAVTFLAHCYPGTLNPEDEKYHFKHAILSKRCIKNCSNMFSKIVNQVQPKLVVGVGDVVCKYLMGDFKLKFKEIYGAVVKSPVYGFNFTGILKPEKLFMEREFHHYGVKDFKRIKDYMDGKPLINIDDCNLNMITTPQQLYAAADVLCKSTKFAYDIESTGLSFMTDSITCIGFATNSNTAYLLPLTVYEQNKPRSYWDPMYLPEIRKTLTTLYTNNAMKITYNGQFDAKFIRHYLNIPRINNQSFDAMLASHVLNENLNGMRSLKELTLLFLNVGAYAAELYEYKRSNHVTNFSDVPINILGKYCMLDAICSYRLYEIFDTELKRKNLYKLFTDITMPLSNTLMDVEYVGAKIDLKHLADIEKNSSGAVQTLMQKIQMQVGSADFNIRSSKQVSEYLYDVLRLPVTKLTKSGAAATGKDILKKYSKKYPVLETILTCKDELKVLSDIVGGITTHIDCNQHVHSHYAVAGTDSGRLSSSDMNLQNISRDKDIKNLFIADEGFTLIQCDLSQGEFIAYATYAQDSALLQDIANGLDIHKKVAALAGNKALEEVTDTERTHAKRVVFGILYGIGDAAAAELVGCTEAHARIIRETFFNMYPKAAAWLNNIPVVAKYQGYLQTVFGRRRRLAHLFSHPLSEMRSYAERLAKNFLMQSTVADITGRAMITLAPKIRDMKGQIILTVHDSIVSQVPDSYVKQACILILQEITKPVPNYAGIIKADLEIGKSWGALNKVKITAEGELEYVKKA